MVENEFPVKRKNFFFMTLASPGFGKSSKGNWDEKAIAENFKLIAPDGKIKITKDFKHKGME